MDSTTVLDYALFQLTPTRTRCDLVIFARKNYEKIASGLLEPYLSNLRSAKDQFLKGGYSITLKPADSDASSWFTKSTLERFVRFVNTPEVLERFVTIEREIEQIDRSIEQNEVERVGGDHAKEEEHPKVRLQSVLESRKSVLKKEQAMAYARVIVMGFDTNAAYDLVTFSEAFGAVRLREACTNFIELRHKKNDDTMWMNEVALMQESYNDPNRGLYNSLSVETEYRAKEKIQTWANHPQQYHTPQGSMYQQIPPYLGCVLPGSYYPTNVVWPSNNFQDSTNMFHDRDSKGRKRYESKKKSQKNDDRSSYRTSDYSSDERDRELNITSRKNKKKSFVVGNVDYIAGADFSDEGGGYLNSDLIEQKVDEDTCDGEKKDLDWDIFQNLLMKSSETEENEDKGSKRSFQVREDYSSAEHVRDEFLSSANERGVGELEKDHSMELEKFNGVVKKNIKCYEELLIPPRMEEKYNSKNGVLGSEASVTKHQKEDDWFIGNNKQERYEKIDHVTLCRDQESVLGNSQCKVEDSNFDEPEDLYVVLRRDSAAPEKVVRSSWNPEMDFVNDKYPPLETVEIKNKTEDDTSNKRPNTKPARKMDPKSTPGGFIGRSRPDAEPSRRKMSSTVSRKIKSEADKEEEKRKKLEELKIERQKRIAERTAAKAVTTSENNSKKLPTKETIKKNVVTKKTEKTAKRLESPFDDIRKSNKPAMISNATIDRLSTARTSSNKSRVLVQNEKPSSKKTNAVKYYSSKTVKGTQVVQGKGNTSSLKRTGTTSVSSKLKNRSEKAATLEPKNITGEDFEDVKVLHTVISVEKTAPEDSYSSHHHQSKDVASSDDHDKVDPIKHSSDDHHHKTIIEEPSKKIEMQHKIDDPSVVKFDPVIKSNDVKPSVLKHSGNKSDHHQKKKLTFSPELSVVHIISADNRVIESDEEAALSRKKWSDYSESAKAAPKGFRKLLFFGRRI